MFKDKGPGLVGVAFEADRVVGRSRSQLSRYEAAVRVMAVRALHQSLVYAVVVSPRELLTHFQVAAVTELRLLLFHQLLVFLWMMGIVAVRAPDVVLQMCGPAKIRMFRSVFVTAEAACAGVRRGYLFERKYF